MKLRASLSVCVSTAHSCVIAARFKCCKSGNNVGVRSRALVGNNSSRAGDAFEVDKLSLKDRAQFSAHRDSVYAVLKNCVNAQEARLCTRTR